ncbi:hypothetical protein BDV93DRAFT_514984 [Ceratobasidium sp. AG-I]|nr:hypothetical protein BDV93DRAFT_514984 [Ceratobasidium sp. AG-I]
MSGMTEEEFFAFALAKGWTAPPAASAQSTAPIQPVLSTQPAATQLTTTAPLAATVGCEPIAPTPPALPAQSSQSICRPSAPRRPLAATRPSSLIRPNSTTCPNPTTWPAIPMALAQSTQLAQSTPPPPALLTVPAQPAVSTQSTIPTPSTTPAQPTASTRSTAPDRPTGPARVARQAAVAGPTGRPPKHPKGAGAPPPHELSTIEIRELHFQLSQILDGMDPFEIKFVDTYPGRRKTKVDVRGHLGLSKEAFRAIRGSNYLIIQAIRYVLPLLPGFEVYKEGDYWPLQCIASKLFRNGVNVTQNKQRTKARLELENGSAEPGAGSAAALVGEQVIKSDVNPNSEISMQPAELESRPMLNLEVVVAPRAPTARSIHGAHIVIEDNIVANMTHNLGNMSVDPVREQSAFPAEEALEPFALPVELTRATSMQVPALLWMLTIVDRSRVCTTN